MIQLEVSNSQFISDETKELFIYTVESIGEFTGDFNVVSVLENEEGDIRLKIDFQCCQSHVHDLIYIFVLGHMYTPVFKFQDSFVSYFLLDEDDMPYFTGAFVQIQ